MKDTPKRLKSGRYHMQIRDPLNPGRRISITEDTAAMVLARVQHYRGLRSDLKHGVRRPEEVANRLRPREVLTVKQVWTEYIESFPPARVEATKGLWKKHFGPFEGLTVHELTAEKMAEWERWEGTRVMVRGNKKLRGAGVATIKTIWAMLRAALRRKVAARELLELPWGDWAPSGKWGRAREQREALRSIEEVAALLHVARQEDERLREHGRFSDLYARICTLSFTGLRQGELGALGWDDLEELSEGSSRVVTMTVRHQVRAHWKEHNPSWTRPKTPPKAGSAGTLRLHQDVVRALDEQRSYLRAHRMYRPDGPIFPDSKTGTWRQDETCLKPERLRDLAARAGVSCDILRFTTHGLRHTMATLEMLATGDMKTTQQRTRHKSADMLLQYMHAGGRGLPASPLPSTGVLPPSVAHVVPSDGPEVLGAGDDVEPPPARLLPPPPAVHEITAERGREIEEDKADARALAHVVDPERTGQVKPEDLSDLEAAYRRWVDGGRRGVRPPEVTQAMEAARSRAYLARYRRERARGVPEAEARQEARKAGVRAKHAYKGSWARVARRLGEPIGVRELAKGRVDEDDPEAVIPFEDERAAAGAGPARRPILAKVLPFRR